MNGKERKDGVWDRMEEKEREEKECEWERERENSLSHRWPTT